MLKVDLALSIEIILSEGFKTSFIKPEIRISFAKIWMWLEMWRVFVCIYIYMWLCICKYNYIIVVYGSKVLIPLFGCDQIQRIPVCVGQKQFRNNLVAVPIITDFPVLLLVTPILLFSLYLHKKNTWVRVDGWSHLRRLPKNMLVISPHTQICMHV